MKIYKFRNFYFNLTERRLLKNGKYLDLTTKTFDILQLLIESGGEIVTKDEILGKVWNGSFVEEGNLPVHISKLRRLLDETKELPFIETVQGSGYRFVAPINEAKVSDWEKISSDTNYSPSHEVSKEWKFDSIAVLPLENESADPEIEYLADGLSESFINSLSRLPNLKVIARNTVFRYKNKNADIKEVAETLGVATVLTGRIRVVKDHLIIGIELSKADDGTQLWGIHFNRAFMDIFEIQESVISEILDRLKSEISGSLQGHGVNQITKNPESYRLYLKGKYLVDKRTECSIYKAIECFQKSISCDLLNVYSYVEIVEAYGQLYISGYITYAEFTAKIKPFLASIFEINDSIDVVQRMLGRIAYLDWKFDESEKHFQESLRLNPNSIITIYWYSELLSACRRFSEALKFLNSITHLEPLSFKSCLRIGRAFYKMDRYETALVYFTDALDMEPDNYEILFLMAGPLIELGRFEEAVFYIQKSLDINYNVEVFSMLGYISALKGEKNKAYEIIEQIKSQFNEACELSTTLARIYFALGEKETAYQYLDQAFENHEADLCSTVSDPRLKKIKNEPQFRDLIKRMGIPLNNSSTF